ncbi:hypothetical protein QE381_002573 [Microbacterium sp. SORGH_AS 888]|nr:hypothetical protein [Microbacterium sp. SORGH_AS_0888]
MTIKDAANAITYLAAGRNDLTGLPFNIVPVGGGLYEILCPSGRRDFFALETADYSATFVGTLDEAYQRVFDELGGKH